MHNFKFKESVLNYLQSMKLERPYLFKFSASIDTPVLYSTTYAVMALHLFDEVKNIPEKVKKEISRYIRSFQCDDGLFRDEAISDSPYTEEDWWGWKHLTCHALIALSALGDKADKEIRMLEPLYHRDHVRKWMESREWQEKPDFVSNEVMNRINMLQYMRDVFGKKEAGYAVNIMFEYLDSIQDEETGLWGPPFNTPLLLSRGVQTAYHLWDLYFYDKRPINHMERAIDSCLATQNARGGYGVKLNSTGCEDIDSIVPLVRLSQLTDYRKEDIKTSLERVFKWIMSNRNEDGGFVFLRDESFEYGHPLMNQEVNQSTLFASWWRPLSLAYLSKVIHNEVLDGVNWQFIQCPGYQFWNF